jgi:predicted phosphodiesterase
VRLAITADNHLDQIQNSPERYETFKRILKTCAHQKINLLIIAGDLFERSLANYHDFEELVNQHRPPDTKVVIIPGNHDPDLNETQIAARSIRVYSEPALLPINDDWMMLLVPYQNNKNMGQVIAQFSTDLKDKRWILISHGDYTQISLEQSRYEHGTYFPLTRSDLRRYQPTHTFLGHLHQPQTADSVIYPGSPCPLDRTETGRRRFVIMDTATNLVTSEPLNSPFVYFQETFLLLPGKNQEEKLHNQIQNRIQTWDLPTDRDFDIRPRIQVRGYTSNRPSIVNILTAGFSKYHFNPDTDLDLSDLYNQSDPDRNYITGQFRTWLQSQIWLDDSELPPHDDIMFEALKLIYGDT